MVNTSRIAVEAGMVTGLGSQLVHRRNGRARHCSRGCTFANGITERNHVLESHRIARIHILRFTCAHETAFADKLHESGGGRRKRASVQTLRIQSISRGASRMPSHGALLELVPHVHSA